MTIDFLSENIRRLMKSQGMTVKALAEKSSISTVSLSNLLNNKVTPKTQTIMTIAETLHSSMDDLFRPVPQLKSLRFRTNSSISAREIALRDIVIINSAKWIHDYCNLEEEIMLKDATTGQKPRFDIFFSKKTEPKKLACKIREIWGLGTEPIGDIAELVENSGIKLWLRDFAMHKVFGFSVGELDGGPAIVVNTNANISAERQIFTIAHELGHILMHSNSFTPSETNKEKIENKSEEDEANEFAGELLLPTKEFIEDWNKNQAIPFVDRVLLIKKKYKVSYKTVLKHFSDNSTTENVYPYFYSRYKAIYKQNLSGNLEPESVKPEWSAKRELDYHPTGKCILNDKGFITTVFDGYRKGIIPNESKLSDILQCPYEDATILAAEWDRKDPYSTSL
jgi:Zn-dependent peptidase ImmA (M78 family)/transcriptional regulator with XRE-family HTH domain